MAARTTKDLKVTIVDTGNYWMGVYINGKLKWEGHSITEYELLELVGIKADCVEPESDWAEAISNLPKDLSRVKVRKEEE